MLVLSLSHLAATRQDVVLETTQGDSIEKELQEVQNKCTLENFEEMKKNVNARISCVNGTSDNQFCNMKLTALWKQFLQQVKQPPVSECPAMFFCRKIQINY